MAEDPEFLSMCQDYDACVNALNYWIQSKTPEVQARVNEYRALIRELEAEIIQVLKAAKSKGLD
jgi:hypothetical protein